MPQGTSSPSHETPHGKMDMNSTGVRRFVAACASFCLAAGFCSVALSADCGAGLSVQDKISRFKQLDHDAEAAMQNHRAEEAVRLYEEAVCLVPNSARG